MLIIIKLIASKPLKPSIKLAPFITNKKHKRTNIEESTWLDINGIKNGISMFKIFIGKIKINKKRKSTIMTNLLVGLILNFKSSIKPTENIERLISG